MRIFGIILCLIALVLTGQIALEQKAPKIEADLQERATLALYSLGEDKINVSVDGRRATLEGMTADEGTREQLLATVAAIPGIVGPIDNLSIIPRASAYRLAAAKSENNEVEIEGLAPSPAVKSLIEADARAIFGDDAVVTIDIAEGAPMDDWRAAAGSAFDVLATMVHGQVTIDDTEVSAEGVVKSDEDIDVINFFVDAAPNGLAWTKDVSVETLRAAPYTISVVRRPGAAIEVTGFAPDEATRKSFVEAAEAIDEELPVVADIQIAAGMPDREWPTLVQAGISALEDIEQGRIEVTDNDVSFSGDAKAGSDAPIVTTDLDAPTKSEALVAAPAPSEKVAAVDAAAAPATVAKAGPSTTLTVDKTKEGNWSVRGTVPGIESEELIVGALRQKTDGDRLDIELEQATSSDGGWSQFAIDHLETLDEVSVGRLSINDFETKFVGVVDGPEDVDRVSARLAAIDSAMTIDIQPIDPRPLVSFNLQLSPEDGVVLAGSLPSELDKSDALNALRIINHQGDVVSEGPGSADDWLEDLTQIGTFLPIFEEAEISRGREGLSVRGRLYASLDVDAVTAEIGRAFGEDRVPKLDLAITDVTYADGTRRRNALTGEELVHKGGFWLPVVDFDPNVSACQERSSAILETGKIEFGRGDPDIDARAEPVLNRLAAVAMACFERQALELEIGGHTDSRGARSLNEELSQARADAVLRALVTRGVPDASLIAIGYGDRRPIADNATFDGRAANRRITFEWRESGIGSQAGAEG